MAVKKARKRTKRRTAKRRIAKRRVAKKRTTKKRMVKKRVRRKPLIKKPKENIVGVVTHYFPRVRAAVVKLKAPLSLGDSIRIKGHTTDFNQVVNSIQINCQPLNSAKRGQEIGLLVDYRVRHNDVVYKA